MTLQEVIGFVNAALECSVHLAPTDPGLSSDELLEIGKRAGFQQGELGDAIGQWTTSGLGAKRLMPDENTMTLWRIYIFEEDPDYRNLAAFDFVYSELNARLRTEGAGRANIERSALIERAVARGIARIDIEVAIAMLAMTNDVAENNGILRYVLTTQYSPLPSEQRRQAPGWPPMWKPMREKAYPIVQEVIAARTDGRPTHAEPFDAFADELDKLGYAPFRLWWMQIVSELRRSDAHSTPVSVCVLAATLAEGALTFVARYSPGPEPGVHDSRTFDDPPRTWRIGDLVASAAVGRDTAILDNETRVRAEGLVCTRQRIHASRMLADFPGGVAELSPQQAREAKATAELVVQTALDWLKRTGIAGTCHGVISKTVSQPAKLGIAGGQSTSWSPPSRVVPKIVPAEATKRRSSMG